MQISTWHLEFSRRFRGQLPGRRLHIVWERVFQLHAANPSCHGVPAPTTGRSPRTQDQPLLRAILTNTIGSREGCENGTEATKLLLCFSSSKQLDTTPILLPTTPSRTKNPPLHKKNREHTQRDTCSPISRTAFFSSEEMSKDPMHFLSWFEMRSKYGYSYQHSSKGMLFG